MTNEQIVEKIQRGEQVTDNMLTLWQQNKGFIISVALRYRDYEDIDDLMQQGYLGLYAAVQGYNSSEGVKFLTYAEYWVMRSMKRYIEQCSQVVRISSAICSRIEVYKRFTAIMMLKYGRKPTDIEICTYMCISAAELDTVKQGLIFEHIKSIDCPIDDDGVELKEVIKGTDDTEKAAVDRIERKELKEILWRMVGELTEKEQEVIKQRYVYNKTMPEIEKEMNLKPYAVANIHQRAIKELSRPHRKNKLKLFINDYIKSIG